MEPRRLPADHYTLRSLPGCEQAARDELYVVVALLPDELDTPEARRLLIPLEHPPIVYCRYDFPMGLELRVAGTGVSGGIYLARKLINGPLPVSDALLVAERVAQALGLAHACGTIHDSVSVDTIFLSGADPGQARLLDFGFEARAYRHGLRGDETGEHDERSDIFSLGCVLYQCLTGEPPFLDEGEVETMYRPVEGAAPRLSERMLSVPARLDALVARMLAPHPDDRPERANEVADELARLRARQLTIRMSDFCL